MKGLGWLLEALRLSVRKIGQATPSLQVQEEGSVAGVGKTVRVKKAKSLNRRQKICLKALQKQCVTVGKSPGIGFCMFSVCTSDCTF